MVSTHILSGVTNLVNKLISVLDHYNMLKHTKYTFQVVRHVPVPENRQIDYISGASQRRINILVSTHIFSGTRNPIKALFRVLNHCNMLKHTKYTFKMLLPYVIISTHPTFIHILNLNYIFLNVDIQPYKIMIYW